MHVLMWGLAASLAGAIGALFLKRGAKAFSWSRPVNRNLVCGFIAYVITTVFFIAGLKHAPVSFFYPFTALLYVFAAALGVGVLGERLTQQKSAGIVLIVVGVILCTIAAI